MELIPTNTALGVSHPAFSLFYFKIPNLYFMKHFLLYYYDNYFKSVFNASLLSAVLFFSTGASAQEQKTKQADLLHHEVSYLHDFVSNVKGGLQKGNEHLSMINLRLMVNPDYTSLWQGGSVYINAAMTMGGTPARSLTGDFHGLSNIEAGELIYIHELWYQHRFKHTLVTLGLQDLNREFLVTENSGLLLNSTFGIPSLFAGLATIPIFPHTTAGLTVQHRISKELHIQTALFDGRPDDYGNSNYNLNWGFSAKDGFASISELHYVSDKLTGQETSLKAGFLFHTSSGQEPLEEEKLKTGSVYILADQRIYGGDEGASMGVFLQGVADAGLSSEHFSYLGAGFSVTGLMNARPEDVVSFGYAASLVGHGKRVRESMLELTARFYLKEQFFVQPDIQYIINPCGSESKLNNALVFLLRAGVSIGQ